MEPGESDQSGDRHWTPVEEVLLDALGASVSYSQAAALAGVSKRTVARRMAEPEFARAVSVRRSAWVNEITGQLTALAAEAVPVLREVMLEAARPADRLKAVDIALRLSHRYRTAGELEARLADLETLLAGDGEVDGGGR